MTRDNNETRKTVNAVFFSAIMVISMLAIGFAAAPAAAVQDGSLDAADLDIGDDESQDVSMTVGEDNQDVTLEIGELETAGADLAGASATAEGDAVDGTVDNLLDGTTVTIDADDLNAADTLTVTIEGIDTTEVSILDTSTLDRVNDNIEYTASQANGETDTDTFTVNTVADATLADQEIEADSSVEVTDVVLEDGTSDFVAVWTVTEGGEPETVVGSTQGEDGTVSVDVDGVDEDQTLVAAVHPEGTSPNEDVIYAGDTGEITIAEEEAEAGVTYEPDRPWQGQDVTASGDLIQEGDGAEITEYDLYRVTSQEDGSVESATFVEQVTTDEGEPVLIETDDLDSGDYFLRDGTGPLERNPDMDDTFEVRIQDLDTDFDDDTVADAGGDATTDFEIDSNRGTWTQNVSADGDLDDEELFDIFVDSEEFDYDDADADRVSFSDIETASEAGDPAPVQTFGDFNVFLYDEDDDDADEKIGFYRVSDKEEEVDFTGVDDGDYEFLSEVIDTEAEDTAEVTVEDVADAELEFVDSTVDTAQGGVVGITIAANDAADEGTLVIGEEDDYGYELHVDINDFNDDDEVTVYFNTYTAGTSAPVLDDEENLVYAGTDLDDILWIDEDDEDEDAEIEVDAEATDDLEFILSDGDYDMSVLAEQGDFEETIESPDDIGSLIIDEREEPEMNIWTASSDTVDDVEDVDDVLAGVEAGNITERDLVAQDDYLIHDLGAGHGLDGMFHYIDRSDAEIADLVNPGENADTLFFAKNDEDGEDDRAARLRIRETRDSAGPNAERLRVNAETLNELDLVIDEGVSNVYLAADTDDWNDDEADVFEQNAELDEEEDYEFNTNFRVEDNWVLNFDEDDDDDLSDLFETADSTYDVEERVGEFQEDPTNVTAEADTEITADTNIAPGSEVNMRVRSSGDTRPSFIMTETDLEVTQDEDVTGTFDFNDTAEGDTFDLSLRAGGFPDDVEVDGNVVGAVETDTPTPEPEPEDTPEPEPEDTPEPEPEDTPEPEPEPEDTEEPTDDDTPGFGAVVALIALIAAALLATRRRP